MDINQTDEVLNDPVVALRRNGLQRHLNDTKAIIAISPVALALIDEWHAIWPPDRQNRMTLTEWLRRCIRRGEIS